MNRFLSIPNCDRCGQSFSGTSRTVSRMNTDVICFDCKMEEKTHPKYELAHQAELAELKKGNHNYKGYFYGKKYPFND